MVKIGMDFSQGKAINLMFGILLGTTGSTCTLLADRIRGNLVIQHNDLAFLFIILGFYITLLVIREVYKLNNRNASKEVTQSNVQL